VSFLVDTNILSELVRPRPDSGVERWVRSQDRLFVSAVTVEEIAFGLAWRPHPRIAAWMSSFLERSCEVLPVDGPVARHAGQLRGQLRAAGQTRTQADLLIAATAAARGMTVVTRNGTDFAGCGVAILDPFSSTSKRG
jgi:predicted nucleic acid-binding protein